MLHLLRVLVPLQGPWPVLWRLMEAPTSLTPPLVLKLFGGEEPIHELQQMRSWHWFLCQQLRSSAIIDAVEPTLGLWVLQPRLEHGR